MKTIDTQRLLAIAALLCLAQACSSDNKSENPLGDASPQADAGPASCTSSEADPASCSACILQGLVKGSASDGICSYLGMPYAKPPIGDLRFAAPEPAPGWTGERDATAFGRACAQGNTGVSLTGGAETGEDCLYINVWTPEGVPDKPLPVMVFVYGGGYTTGAANTYFGTGLATKGPAIVVSMNYRLGALGFFAHPDLTRESPHRASGNQGILDQIAGLRWVHDNIGKFGGDPANVTIFGESAGSLDVSVLMTSPLTKGLFRRVIAESGAVVGLGSAATLHSAEERGSAFASKLCIPSASLGDLRAVSAERIIQAQSGFDPKDPRSLEIVVDGYVFPDDPAHVFAAGREHRVGLIVGNNGRERVLTLPPDLRKAIEQVAPAQRDFPVSLRADGRATHQAVVTAMDVLGQLGFAQLNFVTMRASEAATP